MVVAGSSGWVAVADRTGWATDTTVVDLAALDTETGSVAGNRAGSAPDTRAAGSALGTGTTKTVAAGTLLVPAWTEDSRGMGSRFDYR